MEEIVLAVIKDIKDSGDQPELQITEETFKFHNNIAYRVSFKENEVEFREANAELRFSLDHDGVDARSPSDSEFRKVGQDKNKQLIVLTEKKGSQISSNTGVDPT